MLVPERVAFLVYLFGVVGSWEDSVGRRVYLSRCLIFLMSKWACNKFSQNGDANRDLWFFWNSANEYAYRDVCFFRLSENEDAYRGTWFLWCQNHLATNLTNMEIAMLSGWLLVSDFLVAFGFDLVCRFDIAHRLSPLRITIPWNNENRRRASLVSFFFSVTLSLCEMRARFYCAKDLRPELLDRRYHQASKFEILKPKWTAIPTHVALHARHACV